LVVDDITGITGTPSQHNTHTQCSAYAVYGALSRQPPRVYDQLSPKQQQLAKPFLRLCKRRGKGNPVPNSNRYLSRQRQNMLTRQSQTGPSASSPNPSHGPPRSPPQPCAQSQPTSRPQLSSSSRRSHSSKSAARSEIRTILHTAFASADMASFRG